MKIALFAQCMYPPWIEWIKNNSFYLSRELNKTIDLSIISHSLPWKTPHYLEENIDWIKVYRLIPLLENKWRQLYFMVLSFFQVLRFFHKNRVSVVAIQYLETSFLLPLVGLFLFSKIKNYTITLYSTDELNRGYKRLFLRFFRTKISRIVIISEFLRPMVRILWYADANIIYIPLSYDKDRYLSYTHPNKRKKNTILFTAGPIEEAGSFFMVDLAKLLPEYSFIFAMRKFNQKSENEFNLLTSYIQKQGVKNIYIERNVSKMENLLSEVSHYVLPLQTIDIKMLVPVALLEAMSRWTICFVSDLPHLHALVKDQKEVVFFQRDNPFDLKEKIITMSSPTEIIENAFEFAKKFPDYRDIAQQYITLFSSLRWSL